MSDRFGGGGGGECQMDSNLLGHSLSCSSGMALQCDMQHVNMLT